MVDKRRLNSRITKDKHMLIKEQFESKYELYPSKTSGTQHVHYLIFLITQMSYWTKINLLEVL